ncbi:3-deoxy-7-phosphoheptulonate synthase, partial [Vibrio natriegens]
LMVDCSHANSRKDYRRQPLVAEDVIHQIREGNSSIIGLMLESHLNEGNQSAELPRNEMAYGVSITDACISWDSTEELLRHAHQELTPFLQQRNVR